MPRIHCARWVKYGSAWEFLFRMGPRLWSSALNSLSKLLHNMRGNVRDFCLFICIFHIHFLQTYSIDSVTVVFRVVIFSAWDGTLDLHSLDVSDLDRTSEDLSSFGISIDDDINHWVAAAYCRHKVFSLSTFCEQTQVQKQKQAESQIKSWLNGQI